MSSTNRNEPRFGHADVQRETFSTYLAKQFIAKKGFEPASIPEVQEFAAPGNIVLTYMDGYALTILCIVDRETDAKAAFKPSIDQVLRIGEACLKYTGKVNRAKLPVSIGVIEVGPTSFAQTQRLELLKRSSLFAKVIPFAMTADTVLGEVWSSNANWLTKGSYTGFIEKLLAEPRQSDADLTPPILAIAEPSFPLVTTALLALLTCVFAAEVIYGIGPWTGLLEPTVDTLAAFGGLVPNLVLDFGEWYRLLSAPFLHADAGHLVMNGIALYLAGRILENLVGRAWFGAIYAVGALGGSLLSLALTPASVVSVGASGAIMALFAAMLVTSVHYPPGPIRAGLQMNAMYVLIPSLLPLAGAINGHQVDYASHFGGAIAGGTIGFAMLAVWPQTEAWPGYRRVAAAISIAELALLAYPAIAIPEDYQTMTFSTQLIPAAELPQTNDEMKARATGLIARYPHDPRPRLLLAADLLDSNDFAGAARQARAGLSEEKLWRKILTTDVADGLRVMLAIALSQDHRDEAPAAARDACAAVKDGPMRQWLDDQKLCGT
ncbi:rhomboid family intramembrane serine protease [Bradyrhizobium sp.]|uniref:rhomboid family intramembrane serine protease n=1 Tax=Bradyrhizobium sp. TaxID=376 RepID=UPI003C4E6BAA